MRGIGRYERHYKRLILATLSIQNDMLFFSVGLLQGFIKMSPEMPGTPIHACFDNRRNEINHQPASNIQIVKIIGVIFGVREGVI